MDAMASHEQILGCLLGGAIGDAWGSTAEGAGIGAAISQPWHLTDDTQLTIATCEAILDVERVLPERIAARFLVWFREGRLTGVGASTLKALRDLSLGAHWALAGARGERAAGNGAAMRVAPLAFILDGSDARSRQVLRDVCRITHHHDEADVGALAVILAIQAAGMGQEVQLAVLAGRLPDSRVRDRLLALERASERSIQAVAAQSGASGFVVESVPLALLAASRGPDLGFEAVLGQVIDSGGDTDTVASIAGQVMGARIGAGALPAELLSRVPQTRGLDVFEVFASWSARRST